MDSTPRGGANCRIILSDEEGESAAREADDLQETAPVENAVEGGRTEAPIENPKQQNVDRPKEDFSWVASYLLNTRSCITPSMTSELSFLEKFVGEEGQEWNVQGCAEDKHIATDSEILKFTFYRVVLVIMRISPPFTEFQRTALKFLMSAPSQLHPNTWALLKTFEIVMELLGRPISHTMFFNIFEVNRRIGEHVAMKSRTGFKFFKPFSESVKPWKH